MESRARLASIHSYRRQFVMVTKATVTSSKTVDFSFRGPLRFQAHTVLLAVDSDSPDEIIRDNGHRRIAILINTNGSDMTAITRHIEAQIARMKVPTGYYLTIEGNYKFSALSRSGLHLLQLTLSAMSIAEDYAKQNQNLELSDRRCLMR